MSDVATLADRAAHSLDALRSARLAGWSEPSIYVNEDAARSALTRLAIWLEGVEDVADLVYAMAASLRPGCSMRADEDDLEAAASWLRELVGALRAKAAA